MKVLNFGSLNIDKTYEVTDFVQAGQTISTSNYQEFLGGKGLNQSMALARAGADVYHVGVIGQDGEPLRQALKDQGVDTRYVHQVGGHSGHTVIQIDQTGENCILFEAGSNALLSKSMIDQVFADFNDETAWVLLQNEVAQVDYIIHQAHDKGHVIVFNPSPMKEEVLHLPLEKVDYFLINKSEGQAITGQEDVQAIYDRMHQLYPDANVLLTLGDQGARLKYEEQDYQVEAIRSRVVDTTAAGDTFTGYFLAAMDRGDDLINCLQQASQASSLAISKKGAVDSIPSFEEVENMLKERMQ